MPKCEIKKEDREGVRSEKDSYLQIQLKMKKIERSNDK